MAKVILMVIDGFGVGQAPDAEKFGDIGANTFANLAREFEASEGRPLHLPQLAGMGLLALAEQASGTRVNHAPVPEIKGAYGYAAELSTGKDTPSGHWEMAGVPVLFDWGYFSDKDNSFSPEIMAKINEATGFEGMLGNRHASGTVIIEQLGEEHIKSGLPICYTSADSVFQVAAHEEHFGLDNLYKYCETVQKIVEPMNIGRVIARPFVGEDAQSFERTGNRRDYSILPPAPTMLDNITNAGGTVISVGKIADIYAHQGVSVKTKATGIDALTDATIEHIQTAQDNSLIFTNLVNFDQDYGHRRDPVGYGKALEAFDKRIAEIKAVMQDDDLLLFTADHGCDPTWHGSDHTREYVPVLAYHSSIKSVNLGERETFADIGQTIVELFEVIKLSYGTSFLDELKFS
ncbi:phosphopentomutase [Thalassotalea euphylliae]|uniref:Phosphopentomutase n=1 Tax=Thalassotalea euphylliae TaxID=1655234 RepID=A0A3E0TS98_9GAMM|nr:phosphopentomutase [Thalassotalea euphylliae]REL26852.1 phosphopentomutase [Thalassotalea euphylliae]